MNLIKTADATRTMHSEAAPFNHATGRPCGDGFFEPRTEVLFSKCHGKGPVYSGHIDGFWRRVNRAGSNSRGRLFVEASNKTRLAAVYNCNDCRARHRHQFEQGGQFGDGGVPVYEAPSFSNPYNNHWVDSAGDARLKLVGYLFPFAGRLNADGDLLPEPTATPRSKWVLVKF